MNSDDQAILLGGWLAGHSPGVYRILISFFLYIGSLIRFVNARATMLKTKNKFAIFFWLPGLVLPALMLFSSGAQAIPLVLNYSGSVGYSYGLARSEEVESELTTTTVSILAGGFFWRPWFLSTTAGVSLGITESASNTGAAKSSSRYSSANMSLTLFPQSRFPAVLALNYSQGVVENNTLASTGDQTYDSLRVFLSGTYMSRFGFLTRLAYTRNDFDSDNDEFSSNSLSWTMRAKKRHNRYTANLIHIESERKQSDVKPKNTDLTINHTYTPGADAGVNSFFTHSRNDSGGEFASITQNTQGSSVFSWRPSHKPYSINGGARLGLSESESNENKTFGTNFGLGYRLGRALRLNANLSASVNDLDGNESVNTSENAILSFSSQHYVLAGFGYSWSGNVNGAHNSTRDDVSSTNETAFGVGGGHSATRSWVLGRSSSMNLGFSQNAAANDTSAASLSYSIGHGVNLGWSYQGISAATFASVSFNDSRAVAKDTVFLTGDRQEDAVSKYQMLYAQISQRHNLSKVSSLILNASLQASDQSVPAGENTEAPQPKAETVSSASESLTGDISYTHARFAGIYGLRFAAKLQYSRSQTDELDDRETVKGEASWDFQIGLLSASAGIRATENTNGSRSESYNFNVTRAF